MYVFIRHFLCKQHQDGRVRSGCHRKIQLLWVWLHITIEGRFKWTRLDVLFHVETSSCEQSDQTVRGVTSMTLIKCKPLCVVVRGACKSILSARKDTQATDEDDESTLLISQTCLCYASDYWAAAWRPAVYTRHCGYKEHCFRVAINSNHIHETSAALIHFKIKHPGTY